jgi:P2 family phage major capsid protein
MARLLPATEARFARYMDRVLEANEVASGGDPFTIAARSFAVDPTVQQRLLDRMQQGDEGLFARFNNITVTEIKGQKVFMGTADKVAVSTTDTEGGDVRQPVNPIALSDDEYECTRTDFDIVIPFSLLDNWAKFDDFETRIGVWLARKQAEDRLKVGFHGTGRAATSDRDANPLGSDVNTGWLQHIRESAPAQVLDEGIAGGGAAVSVGYDGADYKTVDQLVLEAYHDGIDRHFRAAGDLVCFISDPLLNERHFAVVDEDRPTERIAADEIIRRGRVGGLPVAVVPWFPENTILITSFDNLSRYEQEGSRRRKVEHDPQRRGFVNWEQFNEDFPVEDLGKAFLIENISMTPPA